MVERASVPGGARSHPPKLLDRVRIALRVRHYAKRTEEAYVGWIRRYIIYHDIRHPDEMGSTEVVEFLSDLAVTGRVSASTQNQALAALLFLYRTVLERERVSCPRSSPTISTTIHPRWLRWESLEVSTDTPAVSRLARKASGRRYSRRTPGTGH